MGTFNDPWITISVGHFLKNPVLPSIGVHGLQCKLLHLNCHRTGCIGGTYHMLPIKKDYKEGNY